MNLKTSSLLLLAALTLGACGQSPAGNAAQTRGGGSDLTADGTLAPLATPQNVLPVAGVSASAEQTGNGAARAVDRSLSTYFSVAGEGQWLRLDLGQTRTVGAVDIAWHRGARRQSTFDLELSSDGKTWTRVLSRKTSSGTTLDYERYDIPDASARYVRVTGYGNTENAYTSITEVAVEGAGSATTSQPSTSTVTGGLRPEDYGAKGDGQTDDTQALRTLFQQANSLGRPIVFASGRTYLTGRTTWYQLNLTRDGLHVHGNGATIRVKDGTSTSGSLYVLRIAAKNITVENLTIDGNRGGRPEMTQFNDQHNWFIDGGSVNVRLRNVRGLNSPLDNLYIRDQVGAKPSTSDALYPRDIYLENAEMLGARRNNLSVISSRNVHVLGGKYNGARGAEPQAGIDLEPNRGVDTYGNDGVYLENVETSNNAGGGVDIAQENNHNVVIKNLRSDSNGAALFLAPTGSISVNGLQASNYSNVNEAGVITLVPSRRSGATVRLENIQINNVTDGEPVVHQNYPGNVTIRGLRASNVRRLFNLGESTQVSEVYRDGRFVTNYSQ